MKTRRLTSMTKDEAVEFMISKVEEIERERIAAKFSSNANMQKKLAVDAILKAIEGVTFNDENH